MKINDFLLENKVDEAPQGIISRGLNKLGAKFLPGKWGAQAQGRLDTGVVANKLYKDYYKYLGSSNQQPSIQSLSTFLQSQKIMGDVVKQVSSKIPVKNPQGMSTGEVEKFLMGVSQNLAAGQAPAQDQAQPAAAPGSVPSAEPGVAISQPNGASGATATPVGSTPTPTPTPSNTTTANAPKVKTTSKNKNQVRKQPPTATPQAAPTATAQPAAAPAQPAQQAPAQAPGAGFKRNVKDLTPPTASQPQGGFKTKVPPQQPAAAPAATGGKVAGQVSQTPNAIRKRNARAAAKAPTAAPASPTSTGGQAKANFGATANMGTQLPSYTEEILRKITIAAVSGVPVTRDLYNAASRLMSENNTSLKQIGIKVVLSESTRHTVKLKKI